MGKIKFSAIGGVLLAITCSGAANAETLAIGTSAQGAATYAIGAAIAKVAIEKADIRMVVQPHGSTGKVAPLVNKGRLDFGLANILEVKNAVNGRGPFKERAQDKLQVVGVIYPFRVGLFVRDDNKATNVHEIKGLKISSEYTGHKIIKILSGAILANAGLSFKDMQGVPTVNIIGNAKDFTEGKTEVGFFAVGSGKVAQMNAAVGGLHFLSLDNSPDGVMRLKKALKPAYIELVQPRKGLVGVTKPTYLMAYEYLLYAGAHVSADDVYKLVKMMGENKAALAAARSTFSDLDPATMGKDIGLAYHPGAIKYYKEKGLWQR